MEFFAFLKFLERNGSIFAMTMKFISKKFRPREFNFGQKLEKQKQITFVNVFLSLTFIYCGAETEPDVWKKHLDI